MARFQRSVELPHPVSLLDDHLSVNCPIRPVHQIAERRIVPTHIQPIEALLLNPSDNCVVVYDPACKVGNPERTRHYA